MAAMLAAAAVATMLAIVTQDQAALRAAPSATAAPHAQLWQGDLLEVRGQRLDHLQVYDYRRERAGYIRVSQVRTVDLTEAEAPQLLAVLRFVRDTPGAEALGMAYAAAYLKAVPAGQITAEPFDALGVLAERMARRAAAQAAPSATVTAHMEVAAQYGVKFTSYEHNGSLRLCYDGEAFRRVAAMGTPQATPAQQARAVLALTRHDCVDPSLGPHQRQALDPWRAGLLDRMEPAAWAALDEVTKNRLRLRRAGVWAAIAFGQSRRGEAPQAAAQRALDELAGVNKAELGDDEAADYTEAALRVGAVRWAVEPLPPVGRLGVQLRAGEPGQTCVQLMDRSGTLAERCTYATVWAASARASADGRALVLAVQPMEGWAELWVWRRQADGWVLDVLPPAGSMPGLGYAEFAGWVPGTARKLLVAREARVEGRSIRRFEVLSLDTLATERYAGTPQVLAAFVRWADAQWRRGTVSLR